MSQPDIHLYTAGTMNGYKPVILLEEAGVPYDLTHVNFSKQEQKAPEFLALNPNGKIPTIVDRSEDRAIFESGAILWHLAEKYGKFLPSDPTKRSEVMQWMLFQVGHIGPMMGQAMYFQHIAAPNGHVEPFSIRRYIDESRRLLEVMNARLNGRDWIAVGEYTIADMMLYPWARAYVWARVDIDDLPHLHAWFKRIDARPAVQKALTIPKPNPQFWDANADASAFSKENAARFSGDVKKG
ncbi:glutathione S-transferase family protein [Ruegeria sp. SCP11]|uniref:glutathione S-transferase family protein n=1 Tax=Ruegeria sp. SCP11 TaxID=3141378 RepID=UPI00333935A7